MFWDELIANLSEAVDRNTNLLRSANKYGKNVKAIVVTGSINAITTGDVADRKSRVMSNTEWIPVRHRVDPFFGGAASY